MTRFLQHRCRERHPELGLRCEVGGRHVVHRAQSGLGFVSWKRNAEIPPVIPQRHSPLYSWRWWRIGSRGVLQSITAGTQWHTPVCTTRKLDNGELARVAPRHGYGSTGSNYDWGVYSYKTPKLLRQFNQYLFEKLFNGWNKDYLCIGKVENFGHVVEHEFGFRSQKVIIRELWMFHSTMDFIFNTGWVKATEHRYDCPLHIVPADRLEGWIKYYSEEPENAEDSKIEPTDL